MPDGLQQRAGHQERSLAEAVDQHAGDRRDEEQRGGPGEQPQPGVERAVAEPDLQELRDEEHGAEQRGRRRRRSPRCRPRMRASGRTASAASAPARAARRPRTRPAAGPARRRATTSTSRLPHPAALPRTSPQTTPNTPRGHQRQPGQVERGVRAAALGDAAPGTSGISAEPDRHVQPEDPLPRDALGDRAADQRAAGHGEAVDREEDAQRRAASLGRERGAHQRQRQRGHHRRAHALHRPRGDQRLDRSAPARTRPRRARTARCPPRTAAAGRSGRRAPPPSSAARRRLRL